MRKPPDEVYISLHITDHCQSKCALCLYSMGGGGSVHMDLRAVRQIVSILDKINFRGRLYLSGGEPTLHPFFFDVLRIASRPSRPTVVPTNCRWIGSDQGLIDRMITALRANPGAQMRLSVDRMHLEADRGLIQRVQKWHQRARTCGLCRGREYTYKWTEPSFAAVLGFIKEFALENIAGPHELILAEWNSLECPDDLNPWEIDSIVISITKAVYRNNWAFGQNFEPHSLEFLPDLVSQAQELLRERDWKTAYREFVVLGELGSDASK